jgi:hypothetical protein
MKRRKRSKKVSAVHPAARTTERIKSRLSWISGRRSARTELTDNEKSARIRDGRDLRTSRPAKEPVDRLVVLSRQQDNLPFSVDTHAESRAREVLTGCRSERYLPLLR